MITSRGLIVAGVCVSLTILLFSLIKLIDQLWWAPNRLQNQLGRNGLRGPKYKFLYGNSKEITAMRKEMMSKPMDLSDHNIFPRLQPHIDCWTKIYGKNFVMWYGRQAEVVVTDPDLVKEILTDKDGVYGKEIKNSFVKKLIGNGLVSSQGEKWVKVRKLANHAFHAESLKRMILAMIESTETMLDIWKHKEGKHIDVYEDFRVLTSEVISKTAFGSNYLKGKKFFDLLTNLNLLMCRSLHQHKLPIISKFFKSRDEIESEKLEKEVRELILELIRTREEECTNQEEYGNDFLGSLVKTHHSADESQKITIDDVIDECKTFYVAGQETTNGFLAWVMFLLATHVDWQQKARKEVLNLLGSQNPIPDDLSKLKIIDMIINESLRLYPPAANVTRKVKRGGRLGNLNLPANVGLFIPVIAIHNDPQIWGEEAHRFKPDRFSKGIANVTKNNIATYIPFGLGPRMCVGNNFTIAEAKVALAMILQRYSFTLSPTYIHSPITVLTTRPQFGVQVVLSSLSNP